MRRPMRSPESIPCCSGGVKVGVKLFDEAASIIQAGARNLCIDGEGQPCLPTKTASTGLRVGA